MGKHNPGLSLRRPASANGYRYSMSPERTGRFLLAVALTIVIALGVCAMAAAVMVPTMLGGVGAWPVLAAGCIVLVTALAVLWLSETRRDRRLP